MPYKSDRQRRFFHTKNAQKAGITSKMVQEYDQASKGKKLPEKVKGAPRKPRSKKQYSFLTGKY